ncbi:hypothetical protein SNEBB_002583 [Seison nebaliae]|nr:hypothetical protein SNEBB_002583 [Seison nebaliae]
MVKVNKDEFGVYCKQPNLIRNLSIIAHVDHGKTSLTDSLLNAGGLLCKDNTGSKCSTDSRKDEKERGITIKSTAVSLLAPIKGKELQKKISSEKILINLIDSPGHVDFSSEVTAALRLTDGAIIVVDAVSGVSIQTEVVLKQALDERIKPILVINKIDRCIVEQKLDMSVLTLNFYKIINNLNKLMESYLKKDKKIKMSEFQFSPTKGNVIFASAKYGWGFSLETFARIYLEKNNELQKEGKYEKFLNCLWPFDSKKANKQNLLEQMVMKPVYSMLTALQDLEHPEKLEKILTKLPSLQKVYEQNKLELSSVKLLTHFIMSRWLPLADVLVDCVAQHLPSPLVAQSYRMEVLYEGPLDDNVANGIKNCDENAPLMVYVSKMIPSNDLTRFIGIGRVFSGTISSRQTVRILSSDKENDNNKMECPIQSVMSLSIDPGNLQGMTSFTPGNVIGITGIDKHLQRSGCLTTASTSHRIRLMNFSVSPVVSLAVDVLQPIDLPKMIDGLKKLAKSDPLIQIRQTEQGQHIISGAGELHLEIIFNDLQNFYAKCKLKSSEPIVSFREGILEQSKFVAISKSANNHNKLMVIARPMDEEVSEKLEKLNEKKMLSNHVMDKNDQVEFLSEFMTKNESKRIWGLYPESCPLNLLNDQSTSVQNMSAIKDIVKNGADWVCRDGPLCGEPLRNVQFDIMDAKIHSDNAHRRAGQILPLTRRSLYGALLAATPCLYEPVYKMEVTCTQSCIGTIHQTLNNRRGWVENEELLDEFPDDYSKSIMKLTAMIPVVESFGYVAELKGATSGKAFPQMQFDHWKLLPGSVTDESSISGKIVKSIRERKRMSPNIPHSDEYINEKGVLPVPII